ncbi:antitermination protein [Klebsiella pneumoniae]|uniref:antitermination protein n=1 Tax=Klebsiella pneumoniae TaxID=573 RepID=UPI002800623D|nr:antitermination protein [Klebsiella pneumoniae]EKZ5632416.1 antitermination protein [Klebsiella pneumoniae]ELT5680200.1 antitermination protein [Klebsiella pneumoniae]ELX9539474.1 antitermination protein [Klebsiella pneumoniae]WQB77498.1 antitermination protein [Klebsiella pneumoniae subsp. pneumoniae]WQI85055.1 antitermination protein [Klebsiella pneumoniae subsp. pneumoniae]
MNLESAVKFHSPKSPQLSDAPRATASDSLTGTDVMAAFGMVQSRAPLGFSAFSGKMNLSEVDKKKAVQLLMQYGVKHCDKVAAFRKLETNVKGKILQTLATFAYQDYCRSAASQLTCSCCKGRGVIRREELVVKHPGCGEKTPAKTAKEQVEETCKKCSGRGVISTSCVKCRGRGVAMDRKKSEEQGVPVMSACRQCSGRGYERLPAASCYRAICQFTDAISPGVWDKAVKPFYESLIAEIEKAESSANAILSKVTSKV